MTHGIEIAPHRRAVWISFLRPLRVTACDEGDERGIDPRTHVLDWWWIFETDLPKDLWERLGKRWRRRVNCSGIAPTITLGGIRKVTAPGSMACG